MLSCFYALGLVSCEAQHHAVHTSQQLPVSGTMQQTIHEKGGGKMRQVGIQFAIQQGQAGNEAHLQQGQPLCRHPKP